MSNASLTYSTYFKIHEPIEHKIKSFFLVYIVKVYCPIDTKFNFMSNKFVNLKKDIKYAKGLLFSTIYQEDLFDNIFFFFFLSSKDLGDTRIKVHKPIKDFLKFRSLLNANMKVERQNFYF